MPMAAQWSSVFFNLSLLVMTLTMAATSLQSVNAVEYQVIINATGEGRTWFENEVGVDYTRQILASATNYIWETFQQTNDSDRQSVSSVSLIVINAAGVTFTSNNVVFVRTNYIASNSGDAKTNVAGFIYQEMTHIWQWNGNGQANGGLIEGIADYVRLKAGYAPLDWGKPGEGIRWDQGNYVTAYFLNYLSTLNPGFVAALNRKMRTSYSDSFFQELLGKTVDQLWFDYKAKYAN